MTRKRWRKLTMARLVEQGGACGQAANDLKNAKIISGAYGAYWENTGNSAPRSYNEQYEDEFLYGN